jgi:hypothetical protein
MMPTLRQRVSGTTGSGVSGNTLIRAVQRHAFGRGIGRDSYSITYMISECYKQVSVTLHCVS